MWSSMCASKRLIVQCTQRLKQFCVWVAKTVKDREVYYSMTFIENGIDIHDVFFVECKQLSRPSSGIYSLAFGKYPWSRQNSQAKYRGKQNLPTMPQIRVFLETNSGCPLLPKPAQTGVLFDPWMWSPSMLLKWELRAVTGGHFGALLGKWPWSYQAFAWNEPEGGNQKTRGLLWKQQRLVDDEGNSWKIDKAAKKSLQEFLVRSFDFLCLGS